MCLVSVSSPPEAKLILRDPKPHPKSHWQVICLDARPLGSQKHSGPAFQRLRDDLPEARGEDQTSLYQPFISTYCVPGTVLSYFPILCNNHNPQNNPGKQAR